MYSREQLKTELNDWINECGEYEYFVTLTFAVDISEYKARKLFDQFVYRLTKNIYGRRNKRGKLRLPMFPVLEFTKDGRPHFHFLLGTGIRKSHKELKDLIQYYWKDPVFSPEYYLENHKKKWFKVIKEYTQYESIDYLTKEVFNDIDCVIVEHIKF